MSIVCQFSSYYIHIIFNDLHIQKKASPEGLARVLFSYQSNGNGFEIDLKVAVVRVHDHRQALGRLYCLTADRKLESIVTPL